jgi:hypothetical protein
MYLAQERAYRELHARTVEAIRSSSYGLNNLFEMRAPLSLSNFFAAIRSWAILPVYLSLIVAYFVAAHFGWLATLAIVAK